MPTAQKKTVLFLPAWYPTRNDNMGGIFVRAFGEALSKKLKVHVLHVAADHQATQWLTYTVSNTEDLETHIVYYKKPRRKNKFTVFVEGCLYGFASIYGYFKYRRRNPSPDIFHVFVLTRAAIMPYLRSLVERTPYFITEVWSRYMPEDNSYHGAFRKWLGKAVVKRAKGISTVSFALKNALIGHGLNTKNFEVIHSVVPSDFFKLRLKEKTTNHRVKFLHVSCFDDPIKNISGMLNAFKLVQQEGKDFDLNLVGDGVDFKEMQSHADDIGLKNVTFSGKKIGASLFQAFEEADALVLFSNFETQGCVILEAHAAGMPVIGSKTGGITELIDEDKGLLVAPGDEKALAEAIKLMISNIGNYQQQSIRDYASLHYGYEHIADKFIKFYQQGGADV